MVPIDFFADGMSSFENGTNSLRLCRVLEGGHKVSRAQPLSLKANINEFLVLQWTAWKRTAMAKPVATHGQHGMPT